MSKEFEDIVLKKVDFLETEIKNNNQKISVLEVEVKDTKSKLEDTKHQLEELAENTNNKIGKLELNVEDIGEVVKYLNNNFTRFDFEINRKIDTLFDANTVNREKHDSLEDRISFLDEKSFNHNIRISNLEDKVLTA